MKHAYIDCGINIQGTEENKQIALNGTQLLGGQAPLLLLKKRKKKKRKEKEKRRLTFDVLLSSANKLTRQGGTRNMINFPSRTTMCTNHVATIDEHNMSRNPMVLCLKNAHM